jgi:hypothetical protein
MPSKTDNITNLPDIKGTPKMTEADVMRAIDNYIDNTIKSASNPPHAGNLLHFFELVQNVIWSRQAEESIPEDKRLLVMADDPPSEKELDTEAITFYMKDRESGAFGRTAAGQSRGSVVKEAVHHFRSSQQHPEHLSEKLITMGRVFDNVVTFNIYARSDFQALKRLLWFEDVMDSFRWYFNLHRIKVSELSASRIGKVPVGQLNLSKYSVSFFVRTEDTYQFGSQELKQIVINLDVSKTKEE